MQAIVKQKTGYQVIENTAVTDFWNRYIDYQKKHYPELMLVSGHRKRGSNATWPRYHTVCPGLFIYHKSEFGFIDLTFRGSGDKLVELEKLLWTQLPDHAELGLSLYRTGRSAALRLHVPVLDFKESFDKQKQKVNECFSAISSMTNLTKRIESAEPQCFIWRKNR